MIAIGYEKDDFEIQIKNHDVICFDIFDVLLSKKVLKEEDILELVLYKLEKKGICAKTFIEARKKFIGHDMCLKDIYKCLSDTLCVKKEELDVIYKIELLVWEQVIEVRTKVVQYLDYARQQEREVFVCQSDFFDNDFIIKVLDKYNIVKNDVNNVLKSRQSILDEKNNSRILWVRSQDNISISGIDIFVIKSPAELFQNSSYAGIIEEAQNINERLMLGRLAFKVYEDPFIYNGQFERPIVNTIGDFAYDFIAPFVAGFVQWLFKQILEGDYEKILFSTRDGYIIQELYHEAIKYFELNNLPEDIYFPISRTLCVAATVFDEKDIINYAGVRYALEPEKMLNRRFGLRAEDILTYDTMTYKNVVQYALAHKEKIIKRSKEIRENYRQHIRRLGIEKEKKCALFDFVSSGTCQLLLSKVDDLKLKGLYACRYFPFQGITNYTSEDEKYNLDIAAYTVNKSRLEKESHIFSNYNFLEIVFTSFQPSVASMDENGPVFDEEKRTETDLENVKEAHNAIRVYFKEFLDSYVDGYSISFEFVDSIYGLIDAQYTDERCDYLNKCELIEDFGQGRIKLKRK